MAGHCIAIGPFFTTLLALLLSLLATMWCQMISINPIFEVGEADTLVTMQAGLFFMREVQSEGVYTDSSTGESYYVYTNYCVPFLDYSQYDSKWMAAVVFQSINLFLTVIIILPALLFDTCCGFLSKSAYQAFGLTMCVLCTIFQGLTFLVLASNMCLDNPELNSNLLGGLLYEDSCYLGTGGKTNIAAVVFYFVAGLTCFLAVPNESSSSDRGQPHSDGADEEQKGNEGKPAEEGPIVAETGLAPESADKNTGDDADKE